MYEESIVPAMHPGGGGFSVMQFNLYNLYSMFQKCTNWWTVSNDNLPLCRYLGARIKFYQSQQTDYVAKITTQYPYNSNKLTYPSCQPGMLMLSNHKIILPSKNTEKRKKPYTKIWIKPPPQFTNRWYFQRDISTKPLMLIHTAACSLDNYYINPQSQSNNITIRHLNTKLFQNRQFKNPDKQPYWIKQQGTLYTYLYYTTHIGDIQEAKIKDLIPLTDTTHYTEGMTATEFRDSWTTYKTNWYRYWGNPFMPKYQHETDHIYQTTVSPQTLTTLWTDENKQIKQLDEQHKRVWTKLEEPIILQTRYNPNKDTGEGNKAFLLSNKKAEHGWPTPGIPEIELDGFPLWLLLYGYTDFQKKLEQVQKIDEDYILCFQTNFTYPKYNATFVILDEDFIEGRDIHTHEELPNKTDQNQWFPQYQFQQEAENNILLTGPGTPKSNNYQADEMKIEYKFYWKWGGAPAKMTNVENPTHQTVYPIPNNEHETTSLQNPTQAFENLLYSFDERQFQLTRAATKRIMCDWGLTENLFSITEPTKDVPAQQTLQTLLNQTSPSEEKEKEIQQQLLLLKQQQLQLRNRIFQLISNSLNAE